MILVYHKRTPDFLNTFIVHLPDYVLVAVVESEDLDEAYMLTNSIHCPWTENEQVVCHVPEARSTSIGDALLFGGAFYTVASFGFTKAIESM